MFALETIVFICVCPMLLQATKCADLNNFFAGKNRNAYCFSPIMSLSELQGVNVSMIYFEGGSYNCTIGDWKIIKDLLENGTNLAFLSNSSCPRNIEENLNSKDHEHFVSKLLYTLTDEISGWLQNMNAPHLQSLNLGNNSLTKLPAIPQPRKQPFRFFGLTGNKITNFDEEVLQSYSLHKKLILRVYNNPIICDCSIKAYVEYVISRSPMSSESSWELVKCTYKNESTRPFTMYYSYCMRTGYEHVQLDMLLFALFIVNIAIIIIFCDISKALKEAKTGKQNARVPIIAIIHQKFNNIFKSICAPICIKPRIQRRSKNENRKISMAMLINSNMDQIDENCEPLRRERSRDVISAPAIIYNNFDSDDITSVTPRPERRRLHGGSQKPVRFSE